MFNLNNLTGEDFGDGMWGLENSSKLLGNANGKNNKFTLIRSHFLCNLSILSARERENRKLRNNKRRSPSHWFNH